jgi:serine/threonine protein kinase
MAKMYGGRWEVADSISAGGQGEIFRVRDKSGELPGDWALKRLKRKDRVGRFAQEVAILRRLQHENIIRLVDAQVHEDDSDERSFLVMPIAEHSDLAARLAIYMGHLDSVIEVGKQIASALDYAHTCGIVHRDVKPGNILFPEIGHKVWVADFGISFDQSAGRQTEDGEVVGPRFFIAPELDEGGARQVTPAADVYSLGQMLFYMLSGGRRIARENIFDARYSEYFAKGPRHELLRLLLSKMIAPIETRYRDMTPVLVELGQIENWEQNAVGGLLDTRGLAATGKLQQRMAEELERKTAFEMTREGEINRIASVTSSVIGRITAQLEATQTQIAAGGVLDVRVAARAMNAQPLKVDTGNDTLLEERDSIGISIRLPNDPRRTTYMLCLFVCSEPQYTFPVSDSHYLGTPGDPRMAVLPMFNQFSEHSAHLNSEAGYFYGKPTKYGLPDPIPIMGGGPHYRSLFDHGYHDGNMAIARFNAANWPAAQDDIKRMMSDVLSRMMTYIQQQIAN